ncbi:meiosis expressed 1 protein-like protein [Patagioenas fasciata monilis]|uniref:Meiosis expressed 1 protein-like protein n=1 Tax=Patagioenas fasciata monilis TaxID=372326 RepID=A0A1V4K043_PATFA|nr:meiosis expressed 1 protein-like protein [Patagioenas fasciata monilis]
MAGHTDSHSLISCKVLADLPGSGSCGFLIAHQLICLEEAHSLDEFSTSCKEVLNTSNMKKSEDSGATAKAAIHPKSVHHATKWSEDVENFYRFQQAGYRDEVEYKQVKQVDMVERWPETGFVKKLQRRDNTFYYYDKQRECEDKEVYKVKVYKY